MPLAPSDVAAEAARLSRLHDARLADSYDSGTGEPVPGLRRLDRMHRRGEFEVSWMPRQAREEYRQLARRARSNWLRLVVTVISQRMRVDGFRTGADRDDDDRAWARWQANRLDAAQGRVHRGMLVYGDAYVTVWPNEPHPRIAVDSPLRLYAEPGDSDWDPPALALKRWTGRDGRPVAMLYDDEQAWPLSRGGAGWEPSGEPARHGLGRVPVVRFPNEPDLEGQSQSEIEALIPIQLRINETLLDRIMGQKYASFRQRWVTGMAIPEDESGNPVEPFQAAIDRLWMAEEPDARFGEFSALDVRPLIESGADDIRQLSAISQVPPHYLLRGLDQVGAETLVAAESGLALKVGDKQVSAGEAWEETMRLAALAAGDEAGASDLSSEVVWRDTEARSPAQLVDGLLKLGTLGLPLRWLLERYGLTPQAVDRVLALKAEQDAASARNQAASFGIDSALAALPAGGTARD